MNYMEMMRQREPGRLALVEDGTEYTYGELVDRAVRLSRDETVFPKKCQDRRGRLHVIRRQKILEQLVEFFACSECGLVPLLVPMEAENPPQREDVPKNACMAVATSGSTGEPKILYRTYESWADFFPIQNEIFGLGRDSRLFVQGSLAFSGNLNLYMAQFFAGAAVVAQNGFHPKEWGRVMKQKQIDAIYLIPSKLLCLPQVLKEENMLVRTILSGSQSLGKEDALRLKEFFPNAEIFLYYGASELSYITYVTDKQMDSSKNLIGKPFPGVSVSVCGGEIYVDTPYHAEGVHCPCTLSDRGYMDQEGNLYFAGRSDDIYQIHGRKVSACRVENEITRLPMIRETAVLLLEEKHRLSLTAFVLLGDVLPILPEQNAGYALFYPYPRQDRFLGELRGKEIFAELRKRLKHFEMPCRLVVVRELPLHESGKINKIKLKRQWKEYGMEMERERKSNL